MFGAFGFAQAYFAGVARVIRAHAGRGVGGSGFAPDWGAAASDAFEEQERRRELEREQQEISDLIAAGLLF